MAKALFLDRDGVLNVDKGYVSQIDDFEFVPGVFGALRQAQKQGYSLFIITNQSGIARGLYTEADYHRLTEWMQDQFATENITITGIYFCPYHSEGTIPEFTQASDLRKPNPGMLFLAQQEHGVNLEESILIGDKEADIEAGTRAGLATTILVCGESETETKADYKVTSIRELPELLGWDS